VIHKLISKIYVLKLRPYAFFSSLFHYSLHIWLY